ncbi:MAG: universal stress protein [Flavobacteriaceae bacterium]|nr:universal stress protein [Flavobacteriaceae bacterium]
MKNLLFLTDFSECSVGAIKFALNLYKDSECKCFILNVKESDSYVSDDLYKAGNKTIYDSLFEENKAQLNELITNLKQEFDDDVCGFTPLLDYDELTAAVNQIFKSKEIDLIVMGSNGVSGVKEALFGSNAINVIREVKEDTLIVPREYRFKGPQSLLLVLDSFDPVSGKGMNRLKSFVQEFSLSLDVVRTNPENPTDTEKRDLEQLQEIFGSSGFEYKQVCDVPLHYVVDSLVQISSYDFLALLVQDESFLERLLLHSETKDIAKNIKVPLLVYHY